MALRGWSFVLGGVLLVGGLAAAERWASPAAPPPASEQEARDGVLLEGQFQGGAKAAAGRVRVMREGETFFVEVSNLQLAASGMVRLYFVGLDDASTTHAVDGTEVKYDLGTVEVSANGAPQRFPIPSAPKPDLRSVVLWDPQYGVNLAWAPLHPPGRP